MEQKSLEHYLRRSYLETTKNRILKNEIKGFHNKSSQKLLEEDFLILRIIIESVLILVFRLL